MCQPTSIGSAAPFCTTKLGSGFVETALPSGDFQMEIIEVGMRRSRHWRHEDASLDFDHVETTTVPDVFALVDAAFVVSGAALATGTAGPTAELAFVA